MSQDQPPTNRLLTYGLTAAAFYIAALVFFGPAIHGQFIWDDDYYVTKNSALRQGLDGLQQLWVGIYPEPTDYPVPQYYPMTHTSLWLQARGHDWSTPLNPKPFHVVNILLHATNALLLWIILGKLKIPGAWLAAGLFLLHPVQVESVAWIAERKNVLSGSFALLSLLIYLRFCGLDPAPPPREDAKFALPGEPWKVYALSLVLFLCAILSKSVVGVLPAAILLILWWKHGKITRQDVLPLIPYFILMVAMGVWTGWMERNVVGAAGAEWEHGIFTRIVVAGTAIWFYLYKLIAPFNLAFMYDRWVIRPWMVIFPVGVLGLVVVLWSMRDRIGRGPVVLALLYCGSLFPALGFVNFLPQRYSWVADHFQYHASIAVFVGFAVIVHRLLKPAAVPWVGIILIPLAVLTMLQCRIYAGPEALWRDTVAKTPSSWMAYSNLGKLLMDRNQIPEAVEQFERALSLKGGAFAPEIYINLASIRESHGDIAGAETLYRQAVDSVIAQHQRTRLRYQIGATSHFMLGSLLQRQNRVDEAIEQLEFSLQHNDRQVPALRMLSELYRQTKNIDRSLAAADLAVKLEPMNPANLIALGNAVAETGNLGEALNIYEQAYELDPKNHLIPNNIGRLAFEAKDYRGAMMGFKRSLELKPDFEPARQNLRLAEEALARAATQPATNPVTRPATLPTTRSGVDSLNLNKQP